jgi:hypothetical protein
MIPLLTIKDRIASLRANWSVLDWRARNPRSDARIATEAAAERDAIALKIADLEDKIRTATRQNDEND